MRSLDPLSLAWELWVEEGGRKKKKGRRGAAQKVSTDSHSKGQKGCWAQHPLPRLPPAPAYIGPLSKIVIYAVF